MTASFVLEKSVGKLIEEALRDSRIIPSEQPVQVVDFRKGLDALNNIIKSWQTQGVHLWRLKRAILPLIPERQSYRLGPSGHPCSDIDRFYQTTVVRDETAGSSTTLVLASVTNLSVGDNIGVQVNNDTLFWSTVETISEKTVTLDHSSTELITSGNTVFYFSPDAQIARPLSIFNQTWAAHFESSEIPCGIWSRSEYMLQPVKFSRGIVTGAHFTPDATGGTLYVWQTASSVTNVFRFDYREPLAVYDSIDDLLQVTDEYFQPLKWAVAADIGPQYGVEPEPQVVLESKAAQTLQMALDNDSETGSMYLAPDFYGGAGG